MAAARANPGDPPGTIRSVAGTVVNYAQFGFSGDGGPATQAQLYNPRAVAFGPDGSAYIADALNERIRKVDPNGVISTFAGKGPSDTSAGLQDGATPTGPDGDGGPAAQAVFNQPHGVAVDSKGNVYIADSNDNRIRKVDTSGTITTIAGTGDPHTAPGLNGSPALQAGLKHPKSLFMAANDQLYFTDTDHNMIRVIDLGATPAPTIKTIAGTTQARHFGGDNGPATQANLFAPEGVAVTADGSVYISDSNNNLIRKIDPSGTITTIAGDAQAAAAADAAGTSLPPTDSAGDGGPALQAHLNIPRGIAVDPAGDIFVAEEGGARIRRIDPSGTITTIAGDGTSSGRGQVKGDPGPAPALSAEFNTIHDLTLDKAGNLWVADSKNNLVREITDAQNAPGSTSVPAAGGGNTGGGGGGNGAGPAPTTAAGRSGYWMLGSDGKVYGFGDAHAMGDASANLPAGAKAVHIEPTPDFGGYWIVDDAGDVYAFGDAKPLGNVPAGALAAHEKVTSLSATPSGQGYWLFTTTGRVFTFGDAQNFGDLAKLTLNGAIQSSVPTPTGKGYFMVGSDGGVFAFGDAVFHGSTGNLKLNQPVQSLVPTRDNGGYWLVASDGGIFAFGDAPFKGSMGATRLNKPVVGMVRYGDGYLMVGADGGIFDFSDKPFVGSLGANPPAQPITFAATLDT
jgi:sugar lactone lactonase YvrE